MINQYQVREVGNFIDVFLKVFDSYVTRNCPSRNELGSAEPIHAVFKVTGAINGYLAATNDDFNGVAHRGPSRQHKIEELIELYTTATSDSRQLSAFILEAVDVSLVDDIMYSARKAEPQMTLRIQVNKYRIDFFALTIKRAECMLSQR